MEAVELKVVGMTCGSCVKAATRALSAVPGVDTVEVRLDTGVAMVRGQDLSTRVQEMVAALEAAGYQAQQMEAVSVVTPVTVTPVKVPTRAGCCCAR